MPQFDSVQQRQVTWTIRVMDSRAQNHIAFAPLTCFSGANGTKQAVFMPLNHGTGRWEDSPLAELPQRRDEAYCWRIRRMRCLQHGASLKKFPYIENDGIKKIM